MPAKPKARRAPRQDRSLRTQERLLDAMEELLDLEEPADITVEDIVQRAHLSVGAFYKRFASKQDLLPLLLARMQSKVRTQLEDGLAESHWRGRGLLERIDALVERFAEAQLLRKRVIRACVAGRFTAAQAVSPEVAAEARASMVAMQTWLLACRDEIRHEKPEVAVRLGLYYCLQSLQTALLFDALPPEFPPSLAIAESKRLLARYLSGREI